MASPNEHEMEVLDEANRDNPGPVEHADSVYSPTSGLGSVSVGTGPESQRPLRPRGNAAHGSLLQFLHSDDETSRQLSNGHEQSNGYAKSENTNFTESTVVPRRNLGIIQVTCLILNGTFGSNWFFTTPYYTLALIRSKRVCLVLWAVGGIYSALGMVVFLEYGTALPFTGGALIYLDEVFHRPKLLATVLFAWWWILFASTQGASKTVAQTIISLASGRTALNTDIRLLKFTAIAVITLVCLLLFFARRACIAFNTIAVAYKIVLLLVIFVAGMAASRGPDSGFNDFNVEYPGYSGKDALTAMVYIVLAFQGWENANYVTGEVKDYKRTLKWAGIAAMSILTIMYMLVTLAFFAVADYATLTTSEAQTNSAIAFAEIVFKGTRGMQVALLLSTFSVLMFITYTTARAKQAIAWQRIIPFWRFFGRQDPYYDSPGGGLFLHWIFTVIAILATGSMPSESRNFFTGIYGFFYQVMFVALGLGLLRLRYRMHQYDPTWKPTYLTNNVVLIIVVVIFVAWNIVTLVITSLPNDPGTIPRFWWPISFVIVTAVGVGYWAILRLLQVNDGKRKRSLGSQVGFEIYVYEEDDEVPDDMKFPMYEASLDGSRRRLRYNVTGPLNRVLSLFHKAKNGIARFLAY